MDREELVGIQTIWWVDYQLAVGFLTGSWKSNMDVWISNQLFGNPTACLSWPRCNGGTLPLVGQLTSKLQVDVLSEDGCTAVYYAVLGRHPEVIKLFFFIDYI